MYTQCPECQIAFRVTARVLQQAGGKVRCGGCGYAFSALDNLSEDMPGPILDDGSPQSSSEELEETSRRLLETLNELAGPEDVHIEDTGVEWRVLDEADVAKREQGMLDASDTGSIPVEEEAFENDDIPEVTDEVSAESPPVDPAERRYDDNTPLPDDFDDEDDIEYVPPPVPQRGAEDLEEDHVKFDEMQSDLALSEPDEWSDILDEVDANTIPASIEEELAIIQSQLTPREASDEIVPVVIETAEVDDVDSKPSDIDTQFEMQAEALGITGPQKIIDADDPGAEDELRLLSDIGEERETQNRDAVAEDDDEIDETGDDDLIAVSAALSEGDELELDEDEDEDEDEVEVDEIDDGDLSEDDSEALDIEDVDLEIEETELADLIDDVERIAAEDIDDPVVDFDDSGTADDVPEEDVEEADDPNTDDADDLKANDEADDEAPGAPGDEAKKPTDDKLAASMFGSDDANKYFDENSAHIESIIMEGEVVRSALENEELKEREAERLRAEATISEASKLADTYALNREKLRGGRGSYGPPGRVAVLGIAALSILLIAQFVHATRESLATSELFSKTIAPVYRILGQPITPAWDIKGWRFEGTNGSTNEDESVLTVVSRIGNQADGALPYPLIHVALTDRWEEIIGSRILEPNEYLAGDLDPSKPVTPGDTFTAVISIENPSADATGFKLNVCYQVESGRVRCAIEDFK